MLSDWTQEETHAWYWKPGQESMAEEFMRCKAKASIVYPARGTKIKLPCKFLFLVQLSDLIIEVSLFKDIHSIVPIPVALTRERQ